MRKNKFNLRKTSKASVSLMLSFMMLPVYTFGAAVTDSVRISSARTMAESAADMTAQAGLSDFDSVLKSVYGLFAVSSSEEELQKNLSGYFYRTINNTALTEEDVNGRRYISGLADFFSNPSDADFENLVRLNTEAVNAEFTEGAVLADPAVLKNQITEYMKYTGPLSMSSGILNKLSIFRDFKNQKEAVNAKVDYDKSLESVNSICRDIYNSTSEYNRTVSEAAASDRGDFEALCRNVTEKYTAAVSKMLMHRAAKSLNVTPSFDSNVETYIRDLADDAGQRVFDVCADMLPGYLPDENGNESAFIKKLHDINWDYDDFRIVAGTNEILPELDSVKTITEMYFSEYEELSDKEKEERQSEFNRVTVLVNEMDKLVSTACTFRNDGWKQDADMRCREVTGILNDYCTASDEAVRQLEKTEKAVKKLLKAADDAEKAGLNWKSAIDSLADGDVKNSMRNEYDSGLKGLNKEDISAFLEDTQNNLENCRKVRSMCEEIKFHGESIFREFNYTDTFVPKLYEINVSSVRDAERGAASETACNFILPDDNESVSYGIQGTDSAFFRYLNEVYGGTSVSDTDKKSAGSFLDAVTSLGDTVAEQQEEPESTEGDISANISQKKLNVIRDYLAVPEAKNSFESETESSAGAGEVLDSQQKLLNSTGDFLSGLQELGSAAAGEGMEDLLLSEYIMQMFSCYTSEKEFDGSTVKDTVPRMLSGVQMNAENNVFYRAEAEYILWGSEDMKKNLQYTNALIFGTRFTFNSIYAFTDSEIRTVTTSAAAAIAGWTGFGVPVVKTVLVLSLALAESASDMNRILAGDAVPVYKNSSTWYMKPSGIINALRDNSADVAKAVSGKAGKKAEDIFLKIENSAEGGVDGLTETVNGYVDEFAEEAVNAAVNTISNVIFGAAVTVIENAEEYASKESISEYLTEKLESVEASGSDIESRILALFKKLALERADDIAGFAAGCRDRAADGLKKGIEAAEKEAAQKTEEIVNSLRDAAKDCIGEISSAVKETAASGIEAAGEHAEEYAKDVVENMVTGVSTALTEKFGEAAGVSSSKAPSPASSVTLTYREYLRIFLMLNSLSETKERAMLSRMAVLIDINMNNGMKNAAVNGRRIVPEKDFDITSAHTMITLDADVSVNTWFFGAFSKDAVGTDGDNEGSKSGTAGNKKVVSVRTIAGY